MTLVAHGTPGGGTWAQRTCERCGAWLSPTPDSHEQRGSQWLYSWACRVCGEVLEQPGWHPPSYWQPDDLEGEVGTFPAWDRWLLDAPLVNDLVTLAELFVDTEDEAAIAGKDSLLDHEGTHHAPWGELTGDATDPSGARRALAFLRHGTPLRSDAAVVRLVAEGATLATAFVMQCLVEAAGWHGEKEPPLSLPNPIDVGPVIGWGQESLSARYERQHHEVGLSQWRETPLEAQLLLFRNGAESRLLEAFRRIHTADTQSEWESDWKDLVDASRFWMEGTHRDRRTVR